MAHFRRNHNFSFHDLLWPQYWPSRKIDGHSFVMIPDKFLNAHFCFSLCCLRPKLEVGFSLPPPLHVVEKSRQPAGRWLSWNIAYFQKIWTLTSHNWIKYWPKIINTKQIVRTPQKQFVIIQINPMMLRFETHGYRNNLSPPILQL